MKPKYLRNAQKQIRDIVKSIKSLRTETGTEWSELDKVSGLKKLQSAMKRWEVKSSIEYANYLMLVDVQLHLTEKLSAE